jgi:hypothetical protein
MPFDPELHRRGTILRGLGTFREMLPGSFVERRRQCGRPNCHCASGKPEDLHPQFLLSVLSGRKVKTFHVPAELASEARRNVDLHRRFQQAVASVLEINLRRFLQKKQSRPPQQE